MNLLVNEVLVKTEMVPFNESKGFALRLLINYDDVMYAKIEKLLRTYYCGIISVSELKEGFSEILIPEITTLEIIDFLRMHGFGIVEQPINQ
ncbi:MAG: hypothetical protein WCT50_02485 [Patescibacteria group bacterium]|jgi:hypothetical protein